MDQDQKDLVKYSRIQARYSRLTRRAVALVMIFVILLLLILSLILNITLGRGLFSENPPYVGYVIIVLVFLIFFVIPFVMCLPIIIPYAKRTKNTHQIVVFRKFHNRSASRLLKKIVRSRIGLFGHVFTLSDTTIKSKWYIRIPVFIGQLSFFHFRMQNIQNEKGLTKLRNALENKSWLNVNWLLSYSKIFPIKTNDMHWRRAVELLLEDASLLVFHVGSESVHIEWEVETAINRGMHDKMILLCSEVFKSEALEYQQELFEKYRLRIQLLVYNRKSKNESKQQISELISSILVKNESSSEQEVSSMVIGKRAFRLTGTAIFACSLVLLGLSPFLIPGTVTKICPSSNIALRAYRQYLIRNPKESPEHAQLKNHILNKWPEDAAAISIAFAKSHHRTEAQATQLMLSQFANPNFTDEYKELIFIEDLNISEKAIEISMDSLNSGPFSMCLRLIESSRVDLTLLGMQLINSRSIDSLDVHVTLNALLNKKKHDPKPPEHKPEDVFDFGVFDQIFDDSFDDLEEDLVSGLHALLKENKQVISTEQLIDFYGMTSISSLRFVISASLLERGDASGLKILFDSEIIPRFYYSQYLLLYADFESYMDSILSRDIIFSNLPQLNFQDDTTGFLASFLDEEVNLDNKRINELKFPPSLMKFLIKQYDSLDIAQFGMRIDTTRFVTYLYDELYYAGEENKLNWISGNRELIKKPFSSELLKNRMISAWLLAHEGNMQSAQVAIEASLYENWFGYRSYHFEALEVLSVLESNLNLEIAKELKIDANLNDDIRSSISKINRKIRNQDR